MELLLALLASGGDTTASYKTAFENLLPPNEVSITFGYEHEKTLLNRLINLMRSGCQGNVAVSLLRLCDAYLLRNYGAIVTGDTSGTFKMKQWHLPYSEQLGALRRLAIEGLVLLSDDSTVGEEARGCIYARLSSPDCEEEALRSDVEALSRCLRDRRGSLVEEDRLLYAMQKSCSQLGIDYEELFDAAPSPYYVMAYDAVDEWHINRLDRDFCAFEGIGELELTSLLDYCQSSRAATQFREYDLRQATDAAMLGAVELFGPDYALERFNDLCRSGGWKSLFSYTVQKTVEVCGYERVRYVAMRYGLSSLLAIIDGCIPDSCVNDKTVALILASQADSDYDLSIEAVEHLEAISPGFARRFWRIKEGQLLDDPSRAERYLNRVATSDDPMLLLGQMAGEDTASLRQIYLSLVDRPHFDFNDQILSYLHAFDETIIESLVSLAVEPGGASGNEIARRLGYLSKLSEGSFDALAEAVDKLAEGSSPWLIMALLSPYNGHLQEGFSICDFIVHHMETRHYAPDSIYNMRIVIEELPAEERFEILSKVLSATSDQEVLEALPLMPMSFSGFGSDGFVPQYVEEIEMLERMSDALPDTSEYLTHRVRIARSIETLKREMGKERWQAFHGRF